VERAAHGEQITITRQGKPVAELSPIGNAPVPAAVLLSRWRHLPEVSASRLRADLDAFLDNDL